MKRTLLALIILLLPFASAAEVELLQTDPAPVVAGDYADLTMRFVRDEQGVEIRDVSFNIEPTPLFYPVSAEGPTVTSFRAGETITHTFRMFFSEDIPEGFVDVPVIAKFDGGEISADVPLFVQESTSDPDLFIGDVETIPSELLPDTDDNELTVKLQNLGDKDAELVKAELIIISGGAKPSFAYSLIDSVSTIEAGNEAELDFTIDIDEDTREPLNAILDVRYRAEKDSGNTYDTFDVDIPLVIPVSEAPFLEVVNVTFLDSFRAGSTENRVQLTIRNTGEDEAEEVRVRALPDISYPFIFELTTEYVASKIEPGDEATVQFKMEVVRSASAGDYPVTVRLESLVGETRYAQDDTMLLVAREAQRASTGQIGMGIIVAALILSAFIGFQTLRRRRKKKK